MKTLVVLLAATTLVATALPAAASHTFVGTAEATDLELTVSPPGEDEVGLRFGPTTAIVASGPVEGCAADACASAAAAAEPFGETVTVSAERERQTRSTSAFEVPAALEPVLSGQFGSAAAVADPAPRPLARGTAAGGAVEIHVAESVLAPLKDELDGAVDEIVDSLEPVLEPVQDNEPTDLTENVETLLTDLVPALAENPLATIEVGSSSAEASDSRAGDEELEGVTVARAVAEGGTVVLAPVPSVAPDGLFRITVGEAFAEARTNQQTASAEAEAALATVAVANLTTARTDDYVEQRVESGQGEQCFGESPLVVCVIVAGGGTTSEGAEAAAVAAAVRVLAFSAADAGENPLPGLSLRFAEASAGVNARPGGDPDPPRPEDPEDPDEPDDPTPDPDDDPDPEPDLPATGGPSLLVPALLLLSAATGLTRLRRRHD